MLCAGLCSIIFLFFVFFCCLTVVPSLVLLRYTYEQHDIRGCLPCPFQTRGRRLPSLCRKRKFCVQVFAFLVANPLAPFSHLSLAGRPPAVSSAFLLFHRSKRVALQSRARRGSRAVHSPTVRCSLMSFMMVFVRFEDRLTVV